MNKPLLKEINEKKRTTTAYGQGMGASPSKGDAGSAFSGHQ